MRAEMHQFAQIGLGPNKLTFAASFQTHHESGMEAFRQARVEDSVKLFDEAAESGFPKAGDELLDFMHFGMAIFVGQKKSLDLVW